MRDEGLQVGMRLVLAFLRFWFDTHSTWGVLAIFDIASRTLPAILLLILIVILSGSPERLVF
jgi:hypothetical protein